MLMASVIDFKPDEVAAFWNKAVKEMKENGCWNWTKAPHLPNEYGRIKHKQKQYLSHRVAYFLTRGPIPKGMDVCHTCDNRRCINPAHLWVGTRKENLQDMIKKGRRGYTGLIGDTNNGAKLTHTEVIRIKGLLDLKLSIYEIAKFYPKVGVWSIRCILNKESWSSVTARDFGMLPPATCQSLALSNPFHFS